MMQRLQTTYSERMWLKLGAFSALIASGVLLYWLSGGFPPWAWRLLWQTMPQLPHLWQLRGSTVVAPLAGLVLLSLSLLIMWMLISVAAVNVGRSWLRTTQQARSIASAEQWSVAQTQPQLSTTHTQQHNHEQGTQHMTQQTIHMQAPKQATYALRNVHFFAPDATTMPLQAAVPDDTRTMEPHRPQDTRANTTRGRLHLVQPIARSAPNTSGEMEEDATETDLAVYNARPVRQHARANHTHESSNDEQKQRLPGVDVAEREHISEGLDSSGKLLKALQPGSNEVRLLVGVGLDPGLIRKHTPNEDTLLAIQGTHTTDSGTEPLGLFVVADGMGGHANGQAASRLAIQTMSDVVVPVLMRGSDSGDSGDFMELLKDGVHRANLAIYQRNREQANMMGTTLTAALVVAETAYIVNVGDSRTYHYRQGNGLHPVTHDHSLVAHLVEHGEITRDEIYTHPKRNQIYRCLGDHAAVDIDTFIVALPVGDLLLLCSDGLWEMVHDQEMQAIVEMCATRPTQLSAKLVQAALQQGGADNISVIVVRSA
jgi:serine/threonine protein phosphatase PrpC